MQRGMRRALAVVLMGGMLAGLAPGCTIHLRPSDRNEAEDEAAENNEAEHPDEHGDPGEGSETDDVDDETSSPEEQAYEDLLNVDPQELALKTMATSYAAVMVASLVESQVLDPAAVDEEAIASLTEQYALTGWDAARTWMETPEAVTLAANDGIYPNFACFDEPYSCPQTTECPLSNGEQAFCMVTYCDKGACPWCPWGLGNLVFKSVCAYGCLNHGNHVAGAFILVSHFGPGKKHCTYW
ncbi:hypothetical protein WME97_09745 [Sorangium sp. So ce367]|uniref:hypothetical protein n=1 Tax=Sorangium sp. So ce367 TaxID=3133305 RepID=UPI003F63BE90